MRISEATRRGAREGARHAIENSKLAVLRAQEAQEASQRLCRETKAKRNIVRATLRQFREAHGRPASGGSLSSEFAGEHVDRLVSSSPT